MTLNEFAVLVNRFDNRIEVRTGNEMYNDIVEVLERRRTAQDPEGYDGKYKDYVVCSVDAKDYCELLVWVSEK